MKLTCVLLVTLLIIGMVPAANADVITFNSNSETGVNLTRQDVSGVELEFNLSKMMVEDLNVQGQVMKTIGIPGVILPNNAGAPNLPGMGRLIAIPKGARAEVTIVSADVETIENIEIAPAAPIQFENDDSAPVYKKNVSIYQTDAYYPEAVVVISEPKKMRGVDYVVLGITPFQYNPVTKELKIYKNLRVQVDFNGGSGHFGEDRLRNRYWEPILQSNLVNYQTLPVIDFNNRPHGTITDINVDYIIIVPDDPDFLAWADTLRTWRQMQGISTDVVTLSEIGGNSTSAIESYVNDAYNNWSNPPAAVLLLSDYQSSGLSYGITSPTWSNYCKSDNIYADVDGDDLPDISFARITAQNSTHLSRMITKMLDYERNPPTNPNFYDHPVTAGGWQTERWFILCTEICWGYLHNVLGKDPVREYAIYYGTPGSQWSTNQNTYMLVEYFGPNGLGYIPSTPGHLNDWGANATRINNDINSGAFMVMHRDHGLETGWGEPDYGIGDLSGLNNDDYPFVFTINCLTGRYDYGSQCFTEAFHRMEQGALGLTAASEVSYSFVNDTYIFGIMDYLWPDFDPGYGDPGAPTLNPCFANASGKYYLQASSWPYNPQHKVYTHHLFHHHGDAFITMYSEVPTQMNVVHNNTLDVGAPFFVVTAPAGAMIGLTVNGEIIGSAIGTGSAQSISIIPQQIPGYTMKVTVTKPNFYRYEGDVQIIASSGYGVVEGQVTDQSTGQGLQSEITVYNYDPEIRILTQSDGSYSLYLPIDEEWMLRAEYSEDYTCDFATVVTSEDDTVTQNFVLRDLPVRVSMMRGPDPIVPQGGYFLYTGILENLTDQQQVVDVWLMLDVPNIGIYGPLNSFQNITMQPHQNMYAWNIRQDIPSFAPIGTYKYISYVGDMPEGMFSYDMFNFHVYQAAGNQGGSWQMASWFDQMDETAMPTKVALHENYPNPFNAQTVISFDIPNDANVNLEVYNLMGQKVATLADGLMEAGTHNVSWDASQYSSGVYFYKLSTGEEVFTKRMTLLK
ncbi:MAG: T9SS type A sorting domain-containing protein [candidate division Zixibacteria bacterium]|nr:T9SS type A sorting domain-containing protein [candidate division Zixibacteria bacterium]